MRESEERYRSLADNATDLILELDESGRVLYISPSCSQLIGIPPEALIGLPIEASDLLMHSPLSVDGLSIEEGLQQTLGAGDGINRACWRVTRPDGSEAWLDGIAQRFRRRDGSVRVVVISRDVTRRMRAERELEESEQRYRIVNAMSRDVITEMDSQERLLYVSPTCEAAVGIRARGSDLPPRPHWRSSIRTTSPTSAAGYEHSLTSREPAKFCAVSGAAQGRLLALAREVWG